MSHVQIRTPFLVVGHLLAGSLRATGVEVSVVADPLVDRFRLVHRSGLEPDTLVSLLRAIDPLSPTTSATGALPDGVDFQLDLAEAGGPARMRVHVRAEGQELAARARTELEGLGFGAVTLTEGSVTRARLVHCDTRPLMRQLVRWCARRLGVAAVEEALPIDEDLLELSLVDPETARRPLRTRVVLQVRCDDEPAREAAVRLLQERGFRAVGTTLDPDTTDAFAFRPGPLASETGVDARAINRALRGLLGTLDIDPERWPLVEVADETDDAVIDLPVARWRTGALRPYAGDSAARFDVVLRTDARDRAEPLRAALESIGFASVRVEGLPMPAFGWSIDHGALEPASIAGQALLAAVQALKDGDEATADARLWQVRAGHRLRGRRRDVDAITIDAPFMLAGSDAAAARREVELRRVRVLLRHAPDVDVTETIAALRAMGVRSVRSDERADPEASLQLGGAHLLAVEALARLVAPTFDAPLPLERVWPAHDLDVGLPIRRATGSVAPRKPPPPRAAPVGAPSRAFLEESATTLRIGDVRLEKRNETHPLVPAPALGRALVLDDETARTLLHVARAVQLGEPCLLEGETSTSKTSSIVWLAARLGVPLARLNLHGHTDAGELVGRHLPARGGGFEWCDGLLLRALREGMWVVLDEVNLAESAVVERIDALLERTPTLVLTEHDHRVFSTTGAGGEAIHPGFRVFATMNPTGYAGRAHLSPAFLDRFRAHRFVRTPDESAVASMLLSRLDGAHPTVTVDGEAWWGEVDPCPPNAGLREVPGIREALTRVARFHVAADEALRSEGDRLGATSTSTPTRRALLSVLDLLEHALREGATLPRAITRALDRYYVARVAPGPQRDAMARLLEAHGLDGAA